MFRKLRIVFSVVCAIVCLLLVVLWVRSISALDSWQGRVMGKWPLHIQSAHGKGMVFVLPNSIPPWALELRRFSNVPFIHIKPGDEFSVPIAGSQTQTTYFHQGNRIVIVPFSVLLLVALALAAVLWIPWKVKFSVRALLITTTLVALLLGAVLYAIS